MNRIAIALFCTLAVTSAYPQIIESCNCDCPESAVVWKKISPIQLPSAGQVVGTVLVDAAVLPGTTITLENAVNNFTQISDVNGRFEFFNVPPGKYDLRAHLAGLQPWHKKRITISPGDKQNFEMRMKVDQSQEICVDCGGGLPLLPGGPNFVITREMIDKLPSP